MAQYGFRTAGNSWHNTGLRTTGNRVGTILELEQQGIELAQYRIRDNREQSWHNTDLGQQETEFAQYLVWDSRKQNWHNTGFGTAGNRVGTILELGQQGTELAQN